ASSMPVAIPPGACTTRTVAASLVTPSCEKANTASDFLKICTTRFASTAVGPKMSWKNGERNSRPSCWMHYNVTLILPEPKRQTSSTAALTNLLPPSTPPLTRTYLRLSLKSLVGSTTRPQPAQFIRTLGSREPVFYSIASQIWSVNFSYRLAGLLDRFRLHPG